MHLVFLFREMVLHLLIGGLVATLFVTVGGFNLSIVPSKLGSEECKELLPEHS